MSISHMIDHCTSTFTGVRNRSKGLSNKFFSRSERNNTTACATIQVTSSPVEQIVSSPKKFNLANRFWWTEFTNNCGLKQHVWLFHATSVSNNVIFCCRNNFILSCSLVYMNKMLKWHPLRNG